MKIAGRDELRLLGAVTLLGVIVRLILFLDYLESPFRYFHMVPGLDMQTLLRWSEWGSPGAIPYYTHFRALAALLWNLNGHVHAVEWIVFIHMICGTLTAAATAYAAHRLWRNRISTLAAGVIAGCYAPALMYELSMLQETLQLFTFTLSLAALLWARKYHFRPGCSAVMGMMLAFAAVGRPTAVLWMAAALCWAGWELWRWERKNFRRLFRLTWAFGGMLGALLLVSSFNYFNTRNFNPFLNVLPHAALVANMAEMRPVSGEARQHAVLSVSRTEAAVEVARRALTRVPDLFRSHEIPDNMNYYFIRDHVVSLKFMPGPGLLLPLAVAGGLLLIASGRFLRREGVILLALASLILPICANYPMGRYRLLLLPLFALLAVSAVRAGVLWRPRKVWIPVAVIAVAFGFLINPLKTEKFYRSSDFVAWGLAREQPSGVPNPESMETFARGYAMTGNVVPGMNLLLRLIRLGDFDTAQTLIADMLGRGVGSAPELLFYSSLVRMEQGDIAGAKQILGQIEPGQLEDPARYRLLRDELERRQK